jgi:glycosyltransferase involved in cell wall biosynthesis
MAGLNECGHVIEVVSLDNASDSFVGQFPLKVHALGPALLSYGFTPKLLSFLKNARQNYDLVIVHGLWQFTSFATWLSLAKTNTPYVVFTHGMLDPWFNRAYPLKHLKKIIYWRLAEHKVLRDAACVLFTAEEERVLAAQSFRPYQAREAVVGFGAAETVGDAGELSTMFFGQHPSLIDKQILLYLGRIHEKKGCDLLLRAFAQIKHKFPRTQLVIAGPVSGKYAERLHQDDSLSDKVTWTGMLTGDLKQGALYAASALVLPSHQENFGVVVAEALSCGLPVLISNKVNIHREILADCAGFVENDDLPGTEKLLTEFLTLPASESKQMRLNARACFERRYSIDIVLSKLLVLLQNIIAVNRSE